MKLSELTESFSQRARTAPGKVLFLTEKQCAFGLKLAVSEGLPGLPLNRGYTQLPGSSKRYSFRAIEQ